MAGLLFFFTLAFDMVGFLFKKYQKSVVNPIKCLDKWKLVDRGSTKNVFSFFASIFYFKKEIELNRIRIQVITHFLIFCSFSAAFCQNYNYVQFTTKDGLPGMTVYDICQDNDGYIWCATDNGLARFDGKTFKTYTIEDGLPDNDVLTIMSDKKGRIWIGTFKNEVSYYYKGQIFNKFNDTILAKINIQRSVNHFHETNFGSVMISDLECIYEISSRNIIRQLIRIDDPSKTNVEHFGYGWYGDEFGFAYNDSVFSYDGNRIKFRGITSRKYYTGKHTIGRLNGLDTPIIKVPYDFIRSTIINYKPVFFNTINGAFEVDTILLKISRQYLPRRTVSNTVIDREGNFWFSTIGEGIYKMSSKYSFSIPMPTNRVNSSNTLCYYRDTNLTCAGLTESRLAIIKKNGSIEIRNYENYLKNSRNNFVSNRLNSILGLPDQSILLGFDGFLLKETFRGVIRSSLPTIKNLSLNNIGNVIVTTGFGVFILDHVSLRILDTIYQKRGIDAVDFGGYYYLASISGLKRVHKTFRNEEDLSVVNPILGRRINDLFVEGDRLWIATADKGILCLRRNEILFHISMKNGLSSNNCRRIFKHRNELWVATNRGISKINCANPISNIVVFDESDFLQSNFVNDVWVNDSDVWVATNTGLTYFSKADVDPKPYCKLNIERVNGRYYDSLTQKEILLDYNASSLNVEFLALSYRSAGRIKYFYQLKGMDSSFVEGASSFASYKVIPSGKYEFIVFAINKFGVKSNILTIPVIVKQPFWKSWWFILLVIIFSIFLIFAFLLLQQQFYRNRLEERNLLHKHLFNVEQYALQLQLNPHFIFNCLNSIQQYILKNNAEDANRFLAGFSVLIREALNNSTSRFISINREVRFLERYLKLEQLRFNHKFSFNVTVDEKLDPDLNVVPVMLLQPYLENAIKHGVSSKLIQNGKIELKFINRGGVLWCIVEDNGIGISASRLKRAGDTRRSEVSAMRILKRRVEILNEIGNYDYMLKITDLSNESDKLSGTRVEIKLHRVYGA